MINGCVGMAGWALSGAAGATELASSRAAAAATAHGGMVYRQARSVACALLVLSTSRCGRPRAAGRR